MHRMLALIDHMTDELKDSKSYALCAAKCKDTDRSLSETYSQMARERLEAYKRLKQQCSRLYDEKTRRATEEGKDTTHITEVHEWACEKLTHEECELSKMIEAAR